MNQKIRDLFSKLNFTRNNEPARITNQTVAEHRERILSGGRRFKYPIQYTKHRLVITAAVLGIVVFLMFIIVSWFQLYKNQTTDEFYYRLTRVVPVPVAKVDSDYVKYGDYLLNYKMYETYLNTAERANEAKYAQGGSNKGIYDFYKSQAMQNAIIDTYSARLASDLDVKIDDKQITEAMKTLIQTSSGRGEVSQDVIDRSVERLYGLSPAENKYYLQKSLLRQAVVYRIDDNASKIANEIKVLLDADKNKNFEDIVNQYKDTGTQALTSGWVKKDNKDGGLAVAASRLEKNGIAGPLKPLSGDGYYFVRLLDTNEHDEINYQLLKVPLGGGR